MVAATSEAIGSWPQTVEEFGRLLELTQHELVQFAAWQLGNPLDAEDVVQDVYVQAFRERLDRRHITEVRAYLYRMVRNRCIDLLRTHSRMARAAPEPASPDDPFRAAQAFEQNRRLRGLMGRIPGNEAEVIQYRVWAGLSFSEIAVAVGASVPTVKSRFRYGIEKLRRLLRTGGGSL
ncbi:MAG: RNA polymerase sigma factor [Acidobacteria bacterium]|nr:RNA polymerase sigma factor [Acidobacteriota bacterium]